ncbi:lipid asymmetry maintenance protein MlaB [uncultured Nevskia sp.]|uniref:STAS domain-containing protein n=1 Tax=uncultured Nevskia sp. TaxID=228950 RepID=UPI0025F9F6DD|nr:STAS domain-containing protein [uncultured Nevskia sp.]
MNAAAAEHAVTHRPKAARRSPKAAVRQVLKLDADLGIEQTAALREQLAACIDDVEPVVFAAGEVQRLHTASLQLLLMFCRSRQAAGHATVWRDPSTSLQAAAKVLGLASLLQVDPS